MTTENTRQFQVGETVWAFSHPRAGKVCAIGTEGLIVVDFGSGPVTLRSEYLRTDAPQTEPKKSAVAPDGHRVVTGGATGPKPIVSPPTPAQIKSSEVKAWEKRLTGRSESKFVVPPGAPAGIVDGSELVWVHDVSTKRTRQKPMSFRDLCREVVKDREGAKTLRFVQVGTQNSWSNVDFLLDLFRQESENKRS